MRKLKLQMQITLDGFVCGPNGELDWTKMPWSDDLNSYVGEFTQTFDYIILGRKLAEGFIPYWESVASDPENAEQSSGRFFTDTPKMVFSHTLDQSPWDNTVVKHDLVEEIIQLKKQGGKDIIAYGGANFVSNLLKNGLVDELHLFINPVAIGEGLPIFKEVGRADFNLVSSRSFNCGIVDLVYAR